MRVTFDHVSFAYRGRPLFEDASFEVFGPALVAFMGVSGSGKTTILSLIAGHERVASGAVRYESTDASEAVWLGQSSPVLTRRSALENVMLGPLSRGVDRGAALTASLAALEDLGVERLARKAVSRLSGGERQRVAVARTVATGPGLYLADEPTASLDSDSRDRVCIALKSAASQGSLVLIATHDPYVAGMCDRVLRVRDGRVADDADSI